MSKKPPSDKRRMTRRDRMILKERERELALDRQLTKETLRMVRFGQLAR